MRKWQNFFEKMNELYSLNKGSIDFAKSIYVRFCVLELSELMMYER